MDRIIKVDDNTYKVLNADGEYDEVKLDTISEEEKDKILSDYKAQTIDKILDLRDQVVLIAQILAQQISEKPEEDRTDLENYALGVYNDIINSIS